MDFGNLKPQRIEAERASSNGVKYYLVRWQGQTELSQFTWVPSSEFDPNSEIVMRFQLANSATFAEKSVQTDMPIWIFDEKKEEEKRQEVDDIEDYDYFKNYITKPINFDQKNSNEFLPIAINEFDPKNRQFLTTFADIPEPKWISEEAILSISPDLVASYFINNEKLKA